MMDIMDNEEKKVVLYYVITIILIAGSFFIYKFYESYRVNVENVSSLQNEINDLKKNEKKESVMDSSEIINENQIKNTSIQISTINQIVKDWGDAVVLVKCRWYSATDGSLIKEGYGSGFLSKATNGSSFVNTNKHVVYVDNKYIAQDCDIVLPKYNEVYNVSANYETMVMEDIASWDPYDFSQITIRNPTQIIKNVSKVPKLCQSEPEIGDQLVVLGFPGIGSSKSLTVTEGIVSGIEGFYYVTSAKIDSGNSGGAAFLLKDNCYLGMPTFANVGDVESLGRILDVRKASDAYLGR